MADKIINTSNDVIKGGKFFGNTLTPGGSFSNIPSTTEVKNVSIDSSPNLILTLKEIRDNLNKNITTQTSFVDKTLSKFLSKYTQLLIDYEDIRNTVFFGSAYNEVSYQIKHLSENYPFKAYIANTNKTISNVPNPFNFYYEGNNTTLFFETNTDTVFRGNLDFIKDGKYPWTLNYDVVDVKKNRHNINLFDSVISCQITEVSTIQSHINDDGNYYILGLKTPYNIKENDVIVFYDSANKNVKLGEATIKNIENIPTGYPSYNGNVKYTRIRFNNLTGGSFTNLEILKKDVTGIFKSSGCKTPIAMFEESNTGKWTIKVAKTEVLPKSIQAGETIKVIRDYTTVLSGQQITNVINTTINSIDTSGANYNLIKLNTPVSGEYIDEDELLLAIDNIEEFFIIYEPNIVKLKISGRLDSQSLINYKGNFIQGIQQDFYGLIISPKLERIIEFENQLSGIQKALLNILNPTPWPREPITLNIIIEGDDFDYWIKNPDNLIKNETEADYSYYTDEIDGQDLDLVGHITLDYNETNQLIRRAIPGELIEEMDSESNLFTRYVMLAGKLFDSIKVYIDFLKYTHTLNYSEFNQLSPKFYKQYADHYGIKLYNEQSESVLSELLFDTLQNSSSLYVESQEIINSVKVVEISQKRQKYLLLNLLYLYSKKGTHACMESLINLLGAPDGLITLLEYEYVWDSTSGYGYKRVNNEKVNTPEVTFVIDEDKLVDRENINNPINKPYHYKPIYSQQNVYNLREINLNLDPLESIAKSIYDYLQEKKQYIFFKQGSYVNLQSIDGIPNEVLSEERQYYALPLSFPGKFSGVDINYYIDKNSPNSLSEAKFQLCGLYQLEDSISYENSNGIEVVGFETNPSLISPLNNGDSYVVGQDAVGDFETHDNEIATWNSGWSFVVPGEGSKVKLKNNNTITYSFSNNQWSINSFTPIKLSKTYTYQIPLLRDLPQEQIYSNTTFLNSSYWPNRFPNQNGIEPTTQYIVASLDGKDLVVRLKINGSERIAVCENIFENDGLFHNLKLTYRLEGVEVFLDYKFFSFVAWKKPNYLSPNVITSKLGVICYPKSSYSICTTEALTVSDLGVDTLSWWDIFVGMPNNINININKVGVYEKTHINQPDYEVVQTTSSLGYELEKWYFNVSNQEIVQSSGEYRTDIVNISSRYNSSVPIYSYEPLFRAIDDYFTVNYLKIKLSTVDRVARTNGPLLFNSFFTPSFVEKNLNALELFTTTKYSDNLLQQVGWSSTIHEDYCYENYEKLIDNYYSFASQVLEYVSVLRYSKTIQGKFEGILKQFIPIVINISRYNLLYKFFTSKFRYSKSMYTALGDRSEDGSVSGEFEVKYTIPEKPSKGNYIYWTEESGTDTYIYNKQEIQNNEGKDTLTII